MSKNTQLIWEEKFNDGRKSFFHNHPFKHLKGKRPRPPGPLRRLVSRAIWNAKAPEYGDARLKPLKLPVEFIRYTDTNTEVCREFTDCVEMVHDLQWSQMKAGDVDIKYSFLVAPDGAVFEGRGWDHEADRPSDFKLPMFPLGGRTLDANCIDIAFIGDYSKKRLPKYMQAAALDLIDWGVWHRKVRCCHHIIPISQKDDDANTTVKNALRRPFNLDTLTPSSYRS